MQTKRPIHQTMLFLVSFIFDTWHFKTTIHSFLILQFPSFLFCSVKVLFPLSVMHTIFSQGLWLLLAVLFCYLSHPLEGLWLHLFFIFVFQISWFHCLSLSQIRQSCCCESRWQFSNWLKQKTLIKRPWRIFFSRVNFLCWLLFQYPFLPVLPQQHVKDPGHFAKEQVAGYT